MCGEGGDGRFGVLLLLLFSLPLLLLAFLCLLSEFLPRDLRLRFGHARSLAATGALNVICPATPGAAVPAVARCYSRPNGTGVRRCSLSQLLTEYASVDKGGGESLEVQNGPQDGLLKDLV